MPPLTSEPREYLFCGGMPAAVHAFIESQEPAEVRNAHANILLSYASDFHKYAARISAELAEPFTRAPTLVGSRFKFTHIDPDRRASEIKPAVEALGKAGVIRRVLHTSAQAAPLAADTNPPISKLLFLDVGLMHASLNIEREPVQKPDLLAIWKTAAVTFAAPGNDATTRARKATRQWYYWHWINPGWTFTPAPGDIQSGLDEMTSATAYGWTADDIKIDVQY